MIPDYTLAERWRNLKERLLLAIARATPAPIKYWIVIVAWAAATTGAYASEDATAILVSDLVKRMPQT